MDFPRSSGVILHISSLYTPYGIGDFGPSAYAFADGLQAAGIHFWQMLPLNYTDGGRGFSPYSCLSAFAGNPLYISPDFLVRDNLLKADDIIPHTFEENVVEFDKVHAYKTALFIKAYSYFKETDQKDFIEFCNKEAYWLEDFAVFLSLKNYFQGAWWLDWPAEYKNRDESALNVIKSELHENIEREKFFQFMFFRQLAELRMYCTQKNIRFIGDMPFYVSHDSSDVWRHPEYFKLFKDGRPAKVAGVPPDMFSETGQLWGMPIFNWSALKKDNYSWWVNRVSQTLQTCDIVRLDHFRAFSAYWEISASEHTAMNGKWIKGPGKNFFKAVKNIHEDLPFIAEDLGEIDQPVWDLMGEFNMPGMKILQFAFIEHMAESIHSPHHHVPHGIVYTGTHDNNTVLGWYKNELTDDGRANISLYCDKAIDETSVNRAFIRMAISSVSQVAIWPMQDMLKLGQESMMNRPGSMHGNWQWRMHSTAVITPEIAKKIHDMLALFNRLV